MSDMRNQLRDLYKEETGNDVTEDMFDYAAYADWLELRIMREPKEALVQAMEDSLVKAAVEIDIARMAVKKVFNDK